MRAAAIDMSQGRPRLLIDGAPKAPLIYSTSFLREKDLAIFAELGVPGVSFSATADFHLYGLAKTVWTAPECRDFSELDERLDRIARAHPEAFVIPRLLFCSPPWWDEKHPDDLVVWEDGSTRRPLLHGAQKTTVPSLASAAWRQAMVENLLAVVEHVERSPHRDRVVGYMLNSGNSEEWFHWGVMERYLFDYNPQAVPLFREWLFRRYGDSAALRSAWKRDIDLTAAAIPEPARRKAVDRDGFRDPRTHQDVIDYLSFFADLTAETIALLARTLKSCSNSRLIAGTFYGYVTELTHHPDGVQHSGHLGLAAVLADPNIDFLASPSSYARRTPGDGFTMSMVPPESAALAKKAFFHENDMRTHVLFDDAGYGRTDTGREGAALQRRELAHALCHGQGMWWFDMTGGWYDDPQMKATIRDAVRLMTGAAAFERKSAAEIAVVIDEMSLLAVSWPEARLVHLLGTQCLELSRAGAPFDIVLFRDLDRLPPKKLYLFPILFRADEATRRRIHERLDRDGATGIFFFAPGIVDQSIDLAGAAKISGIALTWPDAERFLVARATVGRRVLEIGTRFWWSRAPIITDPAAVALAHSPDDGALLVAQKTLGRHRSIFSSVPALPGALLRKILAAAGGTVWIDSDDAIYASSDFFAVHARSGGQKTITVPDTNVLYDPCKDIEIPRSGRVFRLHVPAAETWIAFRGSRAAWQDGISSGAGERP